jgi:hypothetical protein
VATRKKAEGIELLKPKVDPVPIHEITLLDWYAGFALLGASPMATDKESAKAAFDVAEAMIIERARRME